MTIGVDFKPKSDSRVSCSEVESEELEELEKLLLATLIADPVFSTTTKTTFSISSDIFIMITRPSSSELIGIRKEKLEESLLANPINDLLFLASAETTLSVSFGILLVITELSFSGLISTKRKEPEVPPSVPGSLGVLGISTI